MQAVPRYQYQWYYFFITDPDCFLQISGTQNFFFGWGVFPPRDFYLDVLHFPCSSMLKNDWSKSHRPSRALTLRPIAVGGK